MKIVTCAQMKQAEAYASSSGISTLRLMENAGSASARFIKNTVSLESLRCTVICGRGNNGGDGFVTARRLVESGAAITIILCCGAPRTPDAAEMFERVNLLHLPIMDYAREPKKCLEAVRKSDVIVDAVFGTGFSGEIDDRLAELFMAVNQSEATVFSLDMPSGADADTGNVAKSCIKATYTIAFAACKVGQFKLPAAGFCGKLTVVNIGIPPEAFQGGMTAELLNLETVKQRIPVRAKESHKGDYGRLLCLCGSTGMTGAAYMSAQAAARCGAGIVRLGVPGGIYLPLAAKLNEVMVMPLDGTASDALSPACLDRCLELAQDSDAVLIGCGLSQNEGTFMLVRELVKRLDCTVVLDADGINAMKGHINILRESKANLILTPHPGEMARLIGYSAAWVQENRLDTALDFAESMHLTLVLKGADTVIAAPDGQLYINPTGNPGMARGGSGDILAGMIASFAAQGFAPADAACCGVYIHGLAGDRCADKLSQYGMLPTDMLSEIPQIFREISR